MANSTWARYFLVSLVLTWGAALVPITFGQLVRGKVNCVTVSGDPGFPTQYPAPSVLVVIECVHIDKNRLTRPRTNATGDSTGFYQGSLKNVANPKSSLQNCSVFPANADATSPCQTNSYPLSLSFLTGLTTNDIVQVPDLCLGITQGTCKRFIPPPPRPPPRSPSPPPTSPPPPRSPPPPPKGNFAKTRCPTFKSGACKNCSTIGVSPGSITVAPFKGSKVPANSATVENCCNFCRTTKGCSYFSFKPLSCQLFNASACDTSNYLTATDRVSGGRCNPSVADDPHFQGGHGVLYDFNGRPDATFALFSDAKFHINMKLSGYFKDSNGVVTESASPGGSIHTWIREAILFWKAQGEVHYVRLVARKGASNVRGFGFMERIDVDGKALPRFQLGDRFETDSGLHISLEKYEQLGPYQVDFYKLVIDGVLACEIRLRSAHRALQLPDDSEVHLNLQFIQVAVSPDVHGILGQTYRDDREERTAHFRDVLSHLNGPLRVDTPIGRGFLDGTMDDYKTSDPLDTSCGYCQFQTAAVQISSSGISFQ